MKLNWPDLRSPNRSPQREPVSDWSRCSGDELLNQFRSENWSKITNSNDRIAILQELENRIAVNQGRSPATVVEMGKNSGFYGAYSGESNRIAVVVQDVPSYEVLDTLIHESNHAFQDYYINATDGLDERSWLMMRAEIARDSDGMLYNYVQTSPLNNMQCCELDSNCQASAFAIFQTERYYSDPEFVKYLESRADYFAKVNDDLDRLSELRSEVQKRQADSAFLSGNLSDRQYVKVLQDFTDENCIDSTVEDSKKMSKNLETAIKYCRLMEKDSARENVKSNDAEVYSDVETQPEPELEIDHLQSNDAEVYSDVETQMEPELEIDHLQSSDAEVYSDVETQMEPELEIDYLQSNDAEVYSDVGQASSDNVSQSESFDMSSSVDAGAGFDTVGESNDQSSEM